MRRTPIRIDAKVMAITLLEPSRVTLSVTPVAPPASWTVVALSASSGAGAMGLP